MLSSSRQETRVIVPPLRWLDGVTPIALCRVTLWGFLALLVTRTVADPDLWGHLRFGLDMLASKSIASFDTYSFTSDVLWVNHEWLAELLIGSAYAAFGAPGLVLLKLTVIGVVAGILLVVARHERANPLARDLFIALAVFATYSRTQVVRPQMFSVAAFAVLLYLMREADRGRDRALWGVPLCFAAWVNFHGGWIVGLAVLGAWMLGDSWQRRSRGRIRMLATIGALSVSATLLNPYGYGLWQFLAETVRAGRPDITDWDPLFQLPASVLVLESVLPIVGLAAWWSGRERWQVPLRDLAVLVLLLVATLRVGRVDAFLQLAIAMAMAPQIIALFERIDLAMRASFRKPSIPVGVIAVALTAYVAIGVIANLRVVWIEGLWIPDRAAAMLLREASPGARVLTWFDWGEYALWQLSPAGIRVSMDGRRETVYSEQVIRDHFNFYEGRPDMIDYPDRIGADHVWLPSRLPVVPRLLERGWTKVLDTGKSVVLARSRTLIERPGSALIAEPDVFPWP